MPSHQPRGLKMSGARRLHLSFISRPPALSGVVWKLREDSDCGSTSDRKGKEPILTKGGGWDLNA